MRVSARSVQRWRQAWDGGGQRDLRSQGPASQRRLSEKTTADATDARASPGTTTGTC
ncbi:hypothetical protein ACFV0C_32425 [Streptomyces sp. NPDC059568]|uniref:hypothetical protein n=1 Tax=Streptomyces sp. NPDC059568 TaxID=3346868 RepID=UPI0036904C17